MQNKGTVSSENQRKKIPPHQDEQPQNASEGISFSPVKASVEWKIASNLDLNQLIDRMKTIPGNVNRR